MTQRAFYSINDDVLERFNALVPPHRRSRTVQELIAKHVDEHDSKLIQAARLIETDPEYAGLKEVSEDADAWGFATLTRLENNEPG